MKYKLWWLPNKEFDETKKFIGYFDSHGSAVQSIYDYFKNLDIDIPYFREWKEPDTDLTIIDYSSHLHYYAIERVDDSGSK